MKRSLSTALFSLFFAMGCGPGQSAVAPPNVAQGNSDVLRIATCKTTAPFITAILIGKRAAQGYPVEIKGLTCVDDSISVSVSGHGSTVFAASGVITAAGTSGDPKEASFDAKFFYNGECGQASANLMFEIAGQGLTLEHQSREVDLRWGQEGLSCLP
jgi:hypothetical protein